MTTPLPFSHYYPMVCKPGEYIFSQGQEGNTAYILRRGQIKVTRSSEDGKEVLVKLLNPGEIFGEVVLFQPGGYPGTAQAITECEISPLDERHFSALLEEPETRQPLIQTLMEKLHYLNTRLFTLMAYDVEERFFRHLEHQYGIKETYSLGITKKDMALAIGTIPETFSRLLSRLTKRNLVRWTEESLWINPRVWDDF